jgi:hypothetical protein
MAKPSPVKPQRPDWARALLAADWEVKHFILQALLPGLTPGQVRTFKRKEREARERRRFCCRMLREEVRSSMPPREPQQLRLPLR